MNLSAAGVRRVAVALQLGAAVGIAAWLTTAGGWPWPAAALAGVLAVLALLALGIATAFAATLSGHRLSAASRPPLPPAALRDARQPLGFGKAIACYAAEYRAVFRMFNWLQPFRSGRPFAPAAPGGPGHHAPTVLLVHGYGCNHAVWLDMQPVLAAAGYRCETIDLEPVLGDIDDYAVALLARLREIAAHTGRPPLVVCHSMGGLAARAALRLARREAPDAAPPCAGIVTLGTPHHGCALARYGTGPNGRQMRCGGDWLRALAASESPRDRARMVSIFSWHDSIAGPAGTGWLEGAGHIALAGIGHVSLLTRPRAAAAVLEALRRLPPDPR